jgi:hypothetical protein
VRDLEATLRLVGAELEGGQTNMQLVVVAQGHPTTEKVLPQHPVGVDP